MDIYDVMSVTGQPRTFLPDPVPEPTIYRVPDHDRFAPNGGNRQEWRVIVLKDSEWRRALRDLYVCQYRALSGHDLSRSSQPNKGQGPKAGDSAGGQRAVA